jgi:Prokaryotic homologs of the JAB domain
MLRDLGGFDETGGPLFGRYKGNEIQLLDACVAVANAAGKTMMLDSDFIDRQIERHRSMTGWQLCGIWHSHVTRTSSVNPSPPDLQCWASYYRFCGRQPFVGVILADPDQPAPKFEWTEEPAAWMNQPHLAGARDGGDWLHPRVGCYVVEGADGELIRWAADFIVEERPWYQH